MEKENIVTLPPAPINNLPPKQRAKQRYQLEQAAKQSLSLSSEPVTMTPLKKLEVIEERVMRLQSINEEVLGEVLEIIGDVGDSNGDCNGNGGDCNGEESGLAKCLNKLKSLLSDYSLRRQCALNRFHYRSTSCQEHWKAQRMHIVGEAGAEEAETAVAMIHRQRGSMNGKGLSSSRSSVSLPSVTLGRKRSLPSLLLPPASSSSLTYKYPRRPSVPCPVMKKPSIDGIDGDVADCDLMAIKGRLMSNNTKQ